MAKPTTLDKLNAAWDAEKRIKHLRTYNGAGKPDKKRWNETVDAHMKRVDRINRMLNRAKWVARWLNELDAWGKIIRDNRKLTGMPPQITTFGNGGQAKSTRDAEQGGNNVQS